MNDSFRREVEVRGDREADVASIIFDDRPSGKRLRGVPILSDDGEVLFGVLTVDDETGALTEIEIMNASIRLPGLRMGDLPLTDTTPPAIHTN